MGVQILSTRGTYLCTGIFLKIFLPQTYSFSYAANRNIRINRNTGNLK